MNWIRTPSARRVCAVFACLLALAVTAPAAAQIGPRPTVISNVRVVTKDGAVLESASIVVRGNRIDQVTEGSVRLRGARVIDGTGLVATPGLIDVSATLGLTGASWSDPTGRTADAFDVFAARALEDALGMGVTSVYLTPSGFSGVGSAGSLMRLARGPAGTIGVPLRERAALHIDLASGSRALDRLTTLDRVRAQFRAARGHGDGLERYEEDLKEYLEKLPEGEKPAGEAAGLSVHGALDDPPPPPPRPRGGRRPPVPAPPAEETPAPPTGERPAASGDGPKKPEEPRANPGHEALLEAMRGEIPVRITAHRSADIINAIELAKEFSLRVIIEGGAEASLLAAELAEAKIPVVLTPPPDTDLPVNTLWRRYDVDSPAILAHAGVRVAMGTGSGPGQHSRFLLDLTARHLGPHGSMFNPIEVVTSGAAQMLGVERELGQLAPGFRADIVLWSGDPLDPASRVMRTFVDGVMVFDRTRLEPVEGEEL